MGHLFGPNEERGVFHSKDGGATWSKILYVNENAGCVDLAMDLIASADGLIEGFRPGVMERLGLSPEACLARNPKLVYGAIRGFGDERTGRSPYTDRPAFDVVAQAMAGFDGNLRRRGSGKKSGAETKFYAGFQIIRANYSSTE